MDHDAMPTSPPGTPRRGSPFRPEREQPRLGIAHLLVWTACVAVYFSITRAVFWGGAVEEPAAPFVFWLADGVGSGTALGGLLVFAARRLRGLPFPSQPGETLLVLLGVGAMMGLAGRLLSFPLLAQQSESLDHVMMFLYQPFSPVTSLILGGAYMMVAGYLGIPRWRLYFVVAAAANVLSCCVPGPRFLSSLVLVAVALKDLRQGVRYRWTHWLGVGIDLWFGAASVVWLAWWAFYMGNQFS